MRLNYQIEQLPKVGERILVKLAVENQELHICRVEDEATARHQVINLLGRPFISHRSEFDDILSAGLQRDGYWEFAESLLLAVLMPRSGIGIDIGANIGCHTLSLARYAGSGGTIYAIEPEPANFVVLCANALLAGQREAGNARCELRRTALGSACGEAPLWRFTNNQALATMYPDEEIATSRVGAASAVPVATLDSLRFGTGGSARLIDRRIDFIKADAQGAELEIVRGAKQTLQCDGPTLCLEFEPYIATDDRCLALLDELEKLGYRECRLFYANEPDRRLLLSQLSHYYRLGDIRESVAKQQIGPYATLLLTGKARGEG